MQKSSITIKPISDVTACRHLQYVERQIWQLSDGSLLSIPILMTLIKNGGLVLGAYDPLGPAESGGLVGFVIGWLGTTINRAAGSNLAQLKHCSVVAGVLPAWQGQGLGLQLKLAQREVVLAEGLTDHATWTYDPLYRVNGKLNIHRLGAICNTYIRNVYGEMKDALNAGLPSDRCQVDWYLSSQRVMHAIAGEPLLPTWESDRLQILPTTRTANNLSEPRPYTMQCDGTPIALPIPDSVAAIRQHDPKLLLTWRLFMREVLEQAFASGYAMVDCVDLPQKGWHYILLRS